MFNYVCYDQDYHDNFYMGMQITLKFKAFIPGAQAHQNINAPYLHIAFITSLKSVYSLYFLAR